MLMSDIYESLEFGDNCLLVNISGHFCSRLYLLWRASLNLLEYFLLRLYETINLWKFFVNIQSSFTGFGFPLFTISISLESNCLSLDLQVLDDWGHTFPLRKSVARQFSLLGQSSCNNCHSKTWILRRAYSSELKSIPSIRVRARSISISVLLIDIIVQIRYCFS